MTEVAAVVTFKSQPGKGSEVARLVAAALPQALNENPMPLWLVLRSEEEPDIVHIVDVFVDKSGRENHLRDATAAQILATVPPHLAEPVKISPMELVAAKGVTVRLVD
ncbi:putative quinol monooxygenase (plasmid) [Ralstonia sp. 25C]|uniref:putative quinol monooxygenase n=1 Tax=Ralstonia sp. 25C TaxID=3447363 RepID=UPI003F7553CA